MKKYLLFAMLLLISAATQAQGHAENDTLTLTIHYIFKSDNTVAAPAYSVDTMAPSERYLVVSPIVEGHFPDRDTVRGRMPDHDVIDTVFYNIRSFKVGTSSDPEDGGTTQGDGIYKYDEEVTVTATPNEGFSFVNWTQGEEVVSETAEYKFQITQDRNLVAHFSGSVPVIDGDIEAPATICAGNVLILTAPTVTNATEQGWQMAAQSNFENFEDYTGQPLDISYNGWKLRYMASNAMGTVYSNVVSIKVTEMSITLTGDLMLCTNQSGTYKVSGAGNAELTWNQTDPNATVSASGNSLTVLWATGGEQTITVEAVNEETGCSATAEITVTVQSFINSQDLQQIVAKKHDGVDYLLIYPNPKDGFKYQWYKNGEAINGATGQYYYPINGLEAGSYRVYVSYNADANGNLFGGAFTDEYKVMDANAMFSVSPNPAHANEGLTVTNGFGTEAVFSIYSIDGRLLHRQTVQGITTLININLPQGVYVTRLSDGINGERMQKIVIE